MIEIKVPRVLLSWTILAVLCTVVCISLLGNGSLPYNSWDHRKKMHLSATFWLLFTYLHLYRKELILNYPLNCIRLLTSLARSRPLSDVNDCRTLSFWQGQQTAGWVEYREGLEWIVNYSGFESLAISVTGALINLIMILILSFFYNRIAVWLTDKELHR